MQREKRVLESSWRYQPDPEESGETYGYTGLDYDASRWREVSLPCSLEAGHPDLEWYVGTSWYRRAFHVPEAWRDRRVVMRFEGVNYHAQVWVNGQLVGQNGDGFLPFEVPIHDVVRFGRENVIAVKADNIGVVGEVPGVSVGWRPYGGILREVKLQATGLCYLTEMYIVAEPRVGGRGLFSLRGSVRNAGALDATVALSVEIVDGADQVIQRLTSNEHRVETGQEAQIRLEREVAGIAAWSPDTPVLYEARAQLVSGASPMDEVSTRIGFRRIETKGSRLLLNGKPIYLTGFNRHEDSPHRGGCTDLVTARRDLLDIKAMGGNFVRLCHYPHHPGELDLCDELGLLAMDEIPLYGSTGMEEDEEQWRAKVENARRQLDTMIRRDWNHPSLIFWSVSNETHEEHAVVIEGNDDLIRYAKELDPSRLSVHVSFRWGHGRRCEGRFDYDDVICVNSYPWMGDPALTTVPRLPEMTQYWIDNLARLHEIYPNKPILIAEFGYRSLEAVFDNMAGEDVHARVLEAQYAGMSAPYVCGATIWCYADHAWPFGLRRGSPRMRTISPYGVVTRDRKPKGAAYWTTRRMFTKGQERE